MTSLPDGLSLGVGKGYYRGNHDPMIPTKTEIGLEPIRVVVELRQDEFRRG
jgi:hypothetical protein